MAISLGGNDMLRGLPPEETRNNLSAIFAELDRRKIRAVLMGMLAPPNLGAEYRSAFDPIYPALAKRYGAGLVPFFLQPVIGKPHLIQPDHIHPNALGVEELVAATSGEWQRRYPLTQPLRRPFADPPYRRLAGDRLERREFGAGQPDLRAGFAQPLEQRAAPQRIEMGGDFVEQQQARPAGIEQSGMGEYQRQQHGLLLAGRAFGGRLVLAREGDGKVVAVRPGQGALGRAVAAAALRQRGREFASPAGPPAA